MFLGEMSSAATDTALEDWIQCRITILYINEVHVQLVTYVLSKCYIKTQEPFKHNNNELKLLLQSCSDSGFQSFTLPVDITGLKIKRASVFTYAQIRPLAHFKVHMNRNRSGVATQAHMPTLVQMPASTGKSRCFVSSYHLWNVAMMYKICLYPWICLSRHWRSVGCFCSVFYIRATGRIGPSSAVAATHTHQSFLLIFYVKLHLLLCVIRENRWGFSAVW